MLFSSQVVASTFSIDAIIVCGQLNSYASTHMLIRLLLLCVLSFWQALVALVAIAPEIGTALVQHYKLFLNLLNL